jgi:hypothetical protein
MKKLLFSIFVLSVVATSCVLTSPPPVSQPPTAYIDLVSPSNAALGETVTFIGHGVDPDGSIAAYSWRSSLDGDLSTSATFETSSLSQGTHTIWFKVQDDEGDWSNEVLTTVIVIPLGVVNAVVNYFDASPGSVTLGGASTLSWNVSGAAVVSIDQDIGNVALSGTRVVSPAKTTIYTLTATNEAGSVTATAQVAVVEVPLHAVELFFITAESGQVRRDGYVGSEPNVGDTKAGVAIQAFLSFDISMIPQGAIIKSASLDATDASVVGFPNQLGLLSVYSCHYSALSSKDFVIGPTTGAIYTTSLLLSKPLGSNLLTNAIQKQVDAGSSRFQLRFQFEKPYYYNNQADYLALGEGRPRLTVEYEK